MEFILKVLFIGLMSAVKFITAAPLASAYGFEYWETLLITSTGGLAGVTFFFQLSKWTLRAFKKTRENIQKVSSNPIESTKNNTTVKKKIFTWKNKFIVKTVRRFGLAGIAFITPVVLSIPLGTFIAFRYFNNKNKVYTYLSLAVFFWSVLLSSLTLLF